MERYEVLHELQKIQNAIDVLYYSDEMTSEQYTIINNVTEEISKPIWAKHSKELYARLNKQ